MDNRADFASGLLERIRDRAVPIKDICNGLPPLDIEARWILVLHLLRCSNRCANHFLHIPKTGGTTFGEVLAFDRRAAVISVDSDPGTFLGQLRSATYSDPSLPVLTRAHHPYSSVQRGIDEGLVQLVFTAYRDPVSLHVSNVNMIMRRINMFLSCREKLTPLEVQFCHQWMDRMNKFGRCFEDTPQFAKELLLSDYYLQWMGSIYSKFFDTQQSIESVRKGQTKVIFYRDFDEMFTDVMGYETKPERRNVSDRSYIDISGLSAEEAGRFVGEDREIVAILKSSFVKPIELKPYFRAEH